MKYGDDEYQNIVAFEAQVQTQELNRKLRVKGVSIREATKEDFLIEIKELEAELDALLKDHDTRDRNLSELTAAWSRRIKELEALINESAKRAMPGKTDSGDTFLEMLAEKTAALDVAVEALRYVCNKCDHDSEDNMELCECSTDMKIVAKEALSQPAIAAAIRERECLERGLKLLDEALEWLCPHDDYAIKAQKSGVRGWCCNCHNYLRSDNDSNLVERIQGALADLKTAREKL